MREYNVSYFRYNGVDTVGVYEKKPITQATEQERTL